MYILLHLSGSRCLNISSVIKHTLFPVRTFFDVMNIKPLENIVVIHFANLKSMLHSQVGHVGNRTPTSKGILEQFYLWPLDVSPRFALQKNSLMQYTNYRLG